jgi:macrodomain Ter protein organizer (MatP/YcbG family)
MARTTLDIDRSVLDEAKALARKRGRTLGETVSVLLAEALAEAAKPKEQRPFRWHSQRMGAKVDLEDKDAVWDILDAEQFGDHRA